MSASSPKRSNSLSQLPDNTELPPVGLLKISHSHSDNFDDRRHAQAMTEAASLRWSSRGGQRLVPSRRRALLRPLTYEPGVGNAAAASSVSGGKHEASSSSLFRSDSAPGASVSPDELAIDMPGKSLPASSSSFKRSQSYLVAPGDHEADASCIQIRQPLLTVPAAPAIEASPFESFLSMLMQMGFNYDEAEVALIYTKCLSVEEAVDFISRNSDAILHSYRPRTPLEDSLSASAAAESAAFASSPSSTSSAASSSSSAQSLTQRVRSLRNEYFSRNQNISNGPQPASLSPLMNELIAAHTADRARPCAVCGLLRSAHLIETFESPGEADRHSIIEKPNLISAAPPSAEDLQRQLEADHRLAMELSEEGADREQAPALLAAPQPAVRRRSVNLSELRRVVDFDNADDPDDDSYIIERQQQLRREFGGRGGGRNGDAADAGLALSAAVQEQMRAADLELEARRARLQAEGVELRACGICLDDVPASEFRNDGFNAACGHAFCESCMREHYRVKIMDADINDLRCVDPRCDRRVTDAEVYAAIGGEASGPLADKFRKFKRNAEVAANPNARWCIKSGCDTFMIGSEARPHLTCPTCSTAVCFSCNGAWHEGQRCDEVIDAQYAQWARGRDIQQCPQCRVRIEKDHGCNHMTCGTCRHQFCWLCRGDYGPNHFSPFNPFGCPGGQYLAEDPDSCFRPGPCGMFLFRLFVLPVLLPLGLALGLAAVALGLTSFFALPVIAGSLALVFGILAVTFVFFFAMRHCDSREWGEELGEAVSTCFEYIRTGSMISCLVLRQDDD